MKKLLIILLFPIASQAQVNKTYMDAFLRNEATGSQLQDTAFKTIILQLNNAIGVVTKLTTSKDSLSILRDRRQDSVKLGFDKVNAVKDKTRDSAILVLQKNYTTLLNTVNTILTKDKTRDTLIAALIKKRTQDSIAYQHDLIAGKKDQLTIKQSGTKPPYRFEFGFDPVFTDDYAALKKAYDALKKRMDAYDASKPLKTVTIQVR